MCTSGLMIKDFARFKRVISGHFHKFQENNNFTYMGTPFSHSFGESNQLKFIGVLDLSSNNLEFIKTPFPNHITINFNCDAGTQDILEYKETDILRVVYSGTQENIDKQSANTKLPEGTKIIQKPTDVFHNNIVLDETITNEAKFNDWATKIKGLDEDTIKLGMDILGACK